MAGATARPRPSLENRLRRGILYFANREYQMSQPSLRPQDVLVLAKLLSYEGRRPPIAQMGVDLSISSPERSTQPFKRLALSGLVSSDAGGNRPLLQAVEEFLVHGVKYAFPARRGEVTRGVPTSRDEAGSLPRTRQRRRHEPP
jgi:hypothetical protein